MAKKIEKRSAADQLLVEIATFADSPAGEALLASEPAMVAKLFIDRARALLAVQNRKAAA